jgi:hypothetical protein
MHRSRRDMVGIRMWGKECAPQRFKNLRLKPNELREGKSFTPHYVCKYV